MIKIYWRFNWYWPWGNSANKDAKRYENLVESAYDIISELDRYGNYIFINKTLK
jgi:hypothetical protein